MKKKLPSNNSEPAKPKNDECELFCMIVKWNAWRRREKHSIYSVITIITADFQIFNNIQTHAHCINNAVIHQIRTFAYTHTHTHTHLNIQDDK